MNLKRIMSGVTALLLSVTCLSSAAFADESTLASTVKSVSTSDSVQALAEQQKQFG